MFEIVARIIEKGTLLTGRPNDVVRENMVAAMHEATMFGVRRVKERTPQGVMGAQGGLLASIQPEVRDTSGGVLGIVGSAYRYGLVVEEGRRPGQKMPPGGKGSLERPLLRWIQVKMGVGRDEADGIEFLVRRKIAKKGTKGAFMFKKTLEEDWPEFQRIFDRYGIRIARELSR